MPELAWIQDRSVFFRHLKFDSSPYAMLQYLSILAEQTYRCNRAPGPTASLVIAETQVIFAGVYSDGDTSCRIEGCEIEDGHCVRNIHAEQRALFLAAMNGICTKSAIIYSILKPCYQCSKALVASGITAIFYAGIAYDEQRTKDLLALFTIHTHYVNIGLEYGNG
jgi:dCMP deaminase